MSFKKFLDEQQYAQPNIALPANAAKSWQGDRKEIVQMWRNLNPNTPIIVNPIKVGHKGTKFRSDGIRLTGTAQFINGVLSRIKDILAYEGNGYKIDIEYREIDGHGQQEGAAANYVCYIYVEQEKPKKLKLKFPKL